MSVPFLDLKIQYQSIRDEVDEAIARVLESTAFAGGPEVAAFEKDFAAFCETRCAVGLGNGTEALQAALIALGIKPGDEVITAANTFIATAEAISFCGAKPVFVDVDEATFNIDPKLIEAAITPRTRAIMPVHLYGQMADMDPILEIARKRGIPVVEDASQAHGARYHGRAAGSLGVIGSFSFYPGKNLGAYGEAGAIVTNDAELARKIAQLRDHGQSKKYYHDVVGLNLRMDGIQGAILAVKLRHLAEWNDRRRRNAELYREALADLDGVVLPEEASYARHVYHIYCVRVPKRDAVLARLAAKGVSCGIHYPVPIHLQKAYADMGGKRGDFPVAERLAGEILSLPMYAELTEAQIEQVAEALRSEFGAVAARRSA